jgi:hypothetical protein
MPIEVRHGSGLEALIAAGFGGALQAGREDTQAQLSRSAGIAQTGARIGASRDMQAQQLREQREMQMTQIEAQADRQKQAADDAMARTALQFGLDKEMREEEFDRQMTGAREEARLQAEQFEYRYTTKQRMEFAKWDNIDRMIDQDPRYDQETKDEMHRVVMGQRIGARPSAMPADPNKPTFTEGQEPGKIWEHGGGLYRTVIKDGVAVPEVVVRPDQTPKYKEMEIQAEREKAMILRRQKWEDEKRRYEIDLDKLEVPIVEKAKEGGWFGIGAEEGGPTDLKRFLTESEKQERLRRHFGTPPPLPGEGQGPSDVELEQELQRRVDAQGPWWVGTAATDAEKQLPPMPGRASMYIREAIKEYKSIKNMPPEVQAAFRQASQMLIQYHQEFAGQ